MKNQEQAELQEPDPTRSYVHEGCCLFYYYINARLIGKTVVDSFDCKVVKSIRAPVRVDK